ncbi:MAG: hypothetical protein ABIS06_08400 [Vicinamibacterales bacterium]
MHYSARMTLVALVFATTMSVAATGRLTGTLLFSNFVCFSFVPLLQLATGLLMLRGSRLERGAALDGYFATHRAWSLWALLMAGIVLILPNPGGATYTLALTAVVPAAMTIRSLLRFSRNCLGDSSRAAWWRVARHQAATVVILLVYLDLSVALWPRVVAVLGR